MDLLTKVVSVLVGGPGRGLMANCGLRGMVGVPVSLLSFPGTQMLWLRFACLGLIGNLVITPLEEGRMWDWEEECYPAVC